MKKCVLRVTGLASVLALAALPAWALDPPIAVPVPEPSAMSLFASGGAAAFGIYVFKRWFKRK